MWTRPPCRVVLGLKVVRCRTVRKCGKYDLYARNSQRHRDTRHVFLKKNFLITEPCFFGFFLTNKNFVIILSIDIRIYETHFWKFIMVLVFWVTLAWDHVILMNKNKLPLLDKRIFGFWSNFQRKYKKSPKKRQVRTPFF